MTITEKISRAKADYDAVYEAGKSAGGGGGQGSYDEGYEAGQKAEYDAFWDLHQENGTRKNYDCLFASWNHNTFYPKYDIKPTSAYMMFRTYNAVNFSNFEADIVKRLNECSVALDTSECTNFQYMCMNSFITHIGVIDTRSASTLYQPFSCNRLHTIDKLILQDNGSQTFTSVFHGAAALENIVIEGVIGQNGFDVRSSTKLSKASIESIMAALSTTTSGLTVTLSKTAVNNAFTTEEWAALVSQHTNWTISLI
jgi:hypothetical protein